MESQKQALRRMAEDIRMRGLSSNTLASYTMHARIFLEFCQRPVDHLDAEDIRQFLSHLVNEKKLSSATVNVYSAAIRFLFAVTLNRTLNYLQIPRQKKRKALPEVLTREEMASILDSCQSLKHKAMLMTVYSSGLRVSEAAALKIQHIDSKTMRIFVRGGKGGKDRYTLLSVACNVSHITSDGISNAFNKAVKKAGITKHVSTHTLRHSFATHLLEDDATLLQIKALLGHASIQSTTVYLHLANVTSGIVSPLDNQSVYRNSEAYSHA
ncbi:site-specific integrase [Alicyclobacillus sp. SO9]|uniref:tyrosine-type recombinase/integrase n=1 Tax=Alicyclobacillus sp. SO9 TaxID=2665646 RepID=UPI0018E8BB80|nr:site-specific integrase [Alicyclobacillus sp. SO9]QQE78411.1 site-specific integrase [Alicyclobacillus sp. SO9]